MPANPAQLLNDTFCEYFPFDCEQKPDEFINVLNFFIYTFAPVPVVKGVYDEYIFSCVTIATQIDIDNLYVPK